MDENLRAKAIEVIQKIYEEAILKHNTDEPQVLELDFCCPECHCSQWYLIENYTGSSMYGCCRCDYLIDLYEVI